MKPDQPGPLACKLHSGRAAARMGSSSGCPPRRLASGGTMHTLVHRVVTATVAALALLLPNMQPALAAPPSNDALRNAIEIDRLPFIHRENTIEATASGPRFCHGNNSSVFFKFTSMEDVSVQADTFGSRSDPDLSVFTVIHGTVHPIGCDESGAVGQPVVRFEAEAGTTYYFEIAACCGSNQVKRLHRLEFALTKVPTVEPEVAVTVDRFATLRPGHILRVSGTLTCNERLNVEVYGTVLQFRGNAVAASIVDTWPGYSCGPDGTSRWKQYVDPGPETGWTGVEFQEGRAYFSYGAPFASNGFEQTSQPPTRTRINIVATDR